MRRIHGTALLCLLPLALLAAERPLLWADFEPPLRSHSGAAVQSIAVSEKPGDAAADHLDVSDAAVQVAGRLSNAGGSQWATLGLAVAADARGGPVDLSGYGSLRIRLASAKPRVLRIRLKGTDTATLNAGCYPVMMQRVGPQATDYVIPLEALEPEPYCGARGVAVEQTLPAVAQVEVTANEAPDDAVRFSVGRIEFLPQAPVPAPQPAAPASAPSPEARQATARPREVQAPRKRPAAPEAPPPQPTRQVVCERNNRYGLMMCY